MNKYDKSSDFYHKIINGQLKRVKKMQFKISIYNLGLNMNNILKMNLNMMKNIIQKKRMKKIIMILMTRMLENWPDKDRLISSYQL